MAPKALLVASLLVLACSGLAHAQDASHKNSGNVVVVGGPATGVVSCTVNANGNVAGINGANCGAGVTTNTAITSPITSVTMFKARKGKALAQIIFTTAAGGNIQCGTGNAKRKGRTITFGAAAPNLATVQVRSCTLKGVDASGNHGGGNGLPAIAYGGGSSLVLGTTAQGIPTNPSPRPSPSRSPFPSPSPSPSYGAPPPPPYYRPIGK